MRTKAARTKAARTSSTTSTTSTTTRPRQRLRLRWWGSTAVGAALIAVTGAGTLAASGWDVRLGPVILLAVAGALAFALLLEVFGPAHLPTGHRHRHADPWRLRHAVPYAAPGRDARVLRDALAITREVSGREPVPDLHERLASLAQDRLRAAYGVDLGDHRSRELLGERAHTLLAGPPKRLRLADLTHIIDRIEEL